MEATIKDLGPCEVKFNSIDIGKTKGGVIFRDSSQNVPVTEDQAGTTPVDHIITGRTIEVEVLLTRPTLAQLVAVIPGASSFSNNIKVSNNAGIAQAANAQKLELSPLVNGVASADKLTVFKAYPKADIELTFDNEGQRVYKVIFNVYPDTANGDRLYQIGSSVA